MVASNRGQARHRCPRPGFRIPHFGFVCWIARLSVRTLSSSASAGHQDFAIWKQGSVVEFASSRHHRPSVLPSGTGTIQVNDLCGRRGISGAISSVKSAWASTHEQYLAVIVHHCRSPITRPVVAVSHRAPSASASNIKISSNLAGTSTEHLPVRRHKHEWIEEWQCQMRCGQITPPSPCTLPDLRLDIGDVRCDRATDHEHVAVRQRGVRWIPSTVVHIRQARPGIVQRVICVSIGQPHIVVYVPTCHEELSIRQKGKARTENVCSCVRSRSIRVCGRIPECGVITEVERGPP